MYIGLNIYYVRKQIASRKVNLFFWLQGDKLNLLLYKCKKLRANGKPFRELMFLQKCYRCRDVATMFPLLMFQRFIPALIGQQIPACHCPLLLTSRIPL